MTLGTFSKGIYGKYYTNTAESKEINVIRKKKKGPTIFFDMNQLPGSLLK